MTQDQIQYRTFCQNHHLPLFFQPWWLDAVCVKGNWNVALSFNAAGKIVGVLPYYDTTYGNIAVIKMPLLTPYSGIWLIYPGGASSHKKLAFERKVMNDLISQLPKRIYYMQHFHYRFSNWLPFHWKGYQQTTLYTYIVKKAASPSQQLAQCNRNIRRNIKKASENLVVENNISTQIFYQILALTFKRQGLSMPFSFEFFQKQHFAIQARRQGRLFVAKDKDENIHAVSYLLWDEQAAYYHLAGEDPQFRQSGASILLIWKAMNYAFETLNLDTFDFLGSTIEPIAEIRRQFGAEQRPHFRIFKSKNRFWELLKVLLGKGKILFF